MLGFAFLATLASILISGSMAGEFAGDSSAAGFNMSVLTIEFAS